LTGLTEFGTGFTGLGGKVLTGKHESRKYMKEGRLKLTTEAAASGGELDPRD
jgi:hypothetical protein